MKSRSISNINVRLPAEGIPHADILSLMTAATKTENVPWETGRVVSPLLSLLLLLNSLRLMPPCLLLAQSGAVYHGQHPHIKLLNEAFGFYSISNPLHPDIWPSVMKFEAEIIAMTSALVSDPDTDPVFGATTSVRIFIYSLQILVIHTYIF